MRCSRVVFGVEKREDGAASVAAQGGMRRRAGKDDLKADGVGVLCVYMWEGVVQGPAVHVDGRSNGCAFRG